MPRSRLQIEALPSDGLPLARVSIPGWSMTGRSGAPELPMVVASVDVPDGAEIRSQG